MDTNQSKYYTVKDLLILLPIGRNSVYRLVNRDDFPKITVGKKFIIPVRKFNEWMDNNLGQEIN